MTESSDVQQFKINAMHGRDAGIWICEGSGLGLGPILFLQALCPNPEPRPLLVKWRSAAPPPKAFQSSRTLPLIYTEAGNLPPWPNFIHLFAPQAPIASKFEADGRLSDWHLTVPLLGIIVLFDRRHDTPSASLSLSWLRRSTASANSKKNGALEWARAQQLPLVIGALGYDNTPTYAEHLRGRYDIPPNIPIAPGPLPADVKRQQANSGMFALSFDRQQVSLDKDYARHVMHLLYQQVTAIQEQA